MMDGNCIQLLPEQYKQAIASARLAGEREGYVKALDEVLYALENPEKYGDLGFSVTAPMIIEKLKSDYQKEVEK